MPKLQRQNPVENPASRETAYKIAGSDVVHSLPGDPEISNRSWLTDRVPEKNWNSCDLCRCASSHPRLPDQQSIFDRSAETSGVHRDASVTFSVWREQQNVKDVSVTHPRFAVTLHQNNFDAEPVTSSHPTCTVHPQRTWARNIPQPVMNGRSFANCVEDRSLAVD